MASSWVTFGCAAAAATACCAVHARAWMAAHRQRRERREQRERRPRAVSREATVMEDAVPQVGLYRADESVLILGDGDFTFSHSLVEGLRRQCDARDSGMWAKVAGNIVATSYDTLEELQRRYPTVVPRTLAALHASGVRVLHGVDATNVIGTLPEEVAAKRFDRVVFNFPHHSGKGRIDVNRKIVAGTLASAQQVLKPAAQGGELHMPLAPGQGGTPLDEPRVYGNHWQVIAAAGEAGMCLTRVTPYDFTPYPGYSVTGRRGSQRTFNSHGALLHVFQLPRVSSPLPATVAELQTRRATGDWSSPAFRREVRVGVPPAVSERLRVESPRVLRLRHHPVSRTLRAVHQCLRDGVAEAGAARRVAWRRSAAVEVNRKTWADSVGDAYGRHDSGLFFLPSDATRGSAANVTILRPTLTPEVLAEARKRLPAAGARLPFSTAVAVAGAVARREAWIDPMSSPVCHDVEVIVAQPGCNEAEACVAAGREWALEVVSALCGPGEVHTWWGGVAAEAAVHPLDAVHKDVARRGYVTSDGPCPIMSAAKEAGVAQDIDAGVSADGEDARWRCGGMLDLGSEVGVGIPPGVQATADVATALPAWVSHDSAACLRARRVGNGECTARVVTVAAGVVKGRPVWWARVHVDALAVLGHAPIEGVTWLWSRHPTLVRQFTTGVDWAHRALRVPTLWPATYEFQLAVCVRAGSVWDQTVLMSAVRATLGSLAAAVLPDPGRCHTDCVDGYSTLAYNVRIRCCDHPLTQHQVRALMKLARDCLVAAAPDVELLGN